MAQNEEEQGIGVPEWVVTYGDMMSLLLTFFIMLVSMSEMEDEGKVRAMMDAIREAFGPTSGPSGVPGRSLLSKSVNRGLTSKGQRSEGGTKKASRKAEGQAGAHRAVKRINHGTVVGMGGPALFKRFDASLTKRLRQNLDIVAERVGSKPNRVMVRGHASPEPLPPDETRVFAGLPVRNQWDLSFARAKAAADYLAKKGIEPHRLLVSAAGDTEPRTLTANEHEQRLNRRVDVFLLDAYINRPDLIDTPNRRGQ